MSLCEFLDLRMCMSSACHIAEEASFGSTIHICICIHTYVDAHAPTYAYTHKHMCMYICMYVCIFTYMHANTHTHTHTHIHTHIRVCAGIPRSTGFFAYLFLSGHKHACVQTQTIKYTQNSHARTSILPRTCKKRKACINIHTRARTRSLGRRTCTCVQRNMNTQT
jgi:hypothetical protein